MKTKPLMLALMSAAVVWCGAAALPVSAQVAVPPPLPAYQPLSDQQLDQLLGPIALYPDPLLAQILPATTLPTQIVMADRYLSSGGDPNQADQQPWDPSVQALTHYPSVLQYLDQNLDWSTEVGQAFLNQQPEVMESIQRLRQSAMNFGNLQSTPQQQVVYDNGEIEILPVDPNVVYVPVYQPAYVFYRGGYGLGFGVACTLGPWLNCDFDWNARHLFFWDRGHPRPANWWHERPAERTAWLAHQGTVWRADDHRGFAVAGRDRGWNAGDHRVPEPRIPEPRDHPGNVPHPAPHPTPAPHPEPGHAPAFHAPERPAPSGAFVGGDNARDVRNFSDRGHASLQMPAHTAPAAPAHAAPAFGGGGAAHGGGSQPRR